MSAPADPPRPSVPPPPPSPSPAGAVNPRAPLREQLRRAWTRVRGGELTPIRAAWSVALGLMVGVLPLPGLHLPIVLGIALPLRLDGAVAYAAANISIPPIAPFLWLTAVQLGSLALRGSTVPLSRAGASELIRHGPGAFAVALGLGSVILGLLLATVGFVLTLFGTRALARRRAARAADPLDGAIERTAMRYRRAAGGSRGSYYYVRGKLRGDPSTRAVAQLAPLGEVLDLGCGRGQLAVLLLEAGAASRVRGCDWDEDKLALARRAAAGLAGEFAQRDVRDVQGEAPADTVLLVDVLHYFDRATQDALLDRAAAHVKPGGRLVLRDADTGRGLRSRLTRWQEGIGTAIRFNRGERVLFRDVGRELVPRLEAQGFACEVRPCWEGTPFSNVLLVATRSGG